MLLDDDEGELDRQLRLTAAARRRMTVQVRQCQLHLPLALQGRHQADSVSLKYP